MKTYIEQPAVISVRLSVRGEIEVRPQYLAYAPTGDLWTAATASYVRFYRGDTLVADHQVRNIAAGAVDFSPDGKTLHLGIGKLDVATGTWLPIPPADDVLGWLRKQGLPVPPTLAFQAARFSPDGEIVVVSATGQTRSRREGLRSPKTGAEDWLVVLDASRKPIRALWHGRGRHQHIAISKDHIAAGGDQGLRVFPRAGGEAVDLSNQLRSIIALAWSPDGQLLAALGEQNKLALWKAGAWDAPVASFQVSQRENPDSPIPYGSSIAFHPTRPLLLSGDNYGFLRMWQIDAGHLSAPLEILSHELSRSINPIAVSPVGDELLVLGGSPRSIHRYQLSLEP